MTDEDRDAALGVSRRSLLRGAGAASATAALPTFPASAAPPTEEVPLEPTGVHIAFGDPAHARMNVGWSGPPADRAVVEYGRDGSLGTEVEATATPVPGPQLVTYAATLTDLDPETTYSYRVVLDGASSQVYSFTTAPEPGRVTGADGLRVTMVGDHGTKDERNPLHRADETAAAVIDRALALDPDLHLAAGDISYANGFPFTWEKYFADFEELFATRPFMTAPGNHEKEPGQGFTQYDARLNELMPLDPALLLEGAEAARRRWYDFTYGNTKFIALNTSADACADPAAGAVAEEAIPIADYRCDRGLPYERDLTYQYNQIQRDYLEETLREAADDPRVTWTVVYFHSPLWTSSDHPPRMDLRDLWGPLLDEYDVDLVLNGHNHVYERSRTLKSDEGRYADDTPTASREYPRRIQTEADATRPTGTTHVTNGAGGSGHYEFPTDLPEWSAVRTNDHYGTVLLDITEERLRVEYHTTEGELLDSVDIRKAENGRPEQANSRPRTGGVPAGQFSPTGSRTDGGSVFTAGETVQVSLRVTADRPLVPRDRVPASWTVLRENGSYRGDVARVEAHSDGDDLVHFDVEPSETVEVTYFLEAPGGGSVDPGVLGNFVDPPETPVPAGSYDFGPTEAQPREGSVWVTVPETTERNYVVGSDE